MLTDERRFLTASEVARLFGYTEKTLANYRWSRKGPPYIKMGHKKILYEIKDVENWIQEMGTKIQTINEISEM